MCGIAGLAWDSLRPASPTFEIVRRMNAAQRHRGPDGEGVLLAGGVAPELAFFSGDGVPLGRSGQGLDETLVQVGLGHRRLSIVDVEGGGQPMSDPSGRVWVSFNGEIYNHEELRGRLRQRGAEFRTRSDTEAIVHAWLAWGEDFLQELDGMFGIALWDERERTLVLARDRLGIKPLVWARVEGALLFASETKGLLASGLVERRPRASAIHRFLHHLYVPAPEGPFEETWQLEPGRALVWRNGSERERRYWRLAFDPAPARSDRDWVEAFTSHLERAVGSHLMSDVPLGAFLSGGLDSSAIVATMARLRSAGSRVITSTVAFDQPDHDESADARLVAEHVGSTHHEVLVRQAEVEAAFAEIMRQYDQPFADSSAVPTFLLCRATRRHVTVALAGDGADELLAGYPRARQYAVMQLLRRAPAVVRRPLAEALARGAPVLPGRLQRRARNLSAWLGSLGDVTSPDDPMQAYVHLRNPFRDGWYERLTTPDFASQVRDVDPAAHIAAVARDSHAPDAVTRLLEVELATYLPNDILQKVDIASMAFGLEVRVPFLDHHLVEFVAGMPLHLKLSLRSTKVVLRRAVASRLPRETLRKKKQGFHLPVSEWLRGRGRPILEEILLSSRSLSRGLFDGAALRALVADHVASAADHGARLWALLQLEAWHVNYVDATGPADATVHRRIDRPGALRYGPAS